jgi:hypothetical protein
VLCKLDWLGRDLRYFGNMSEDLRTQRAAG